jgi:predicted nucleotidyltransferase
VNAMVRERLEQVAELCRRHSVLRLSLFGSAVRQDFDTERSDLDFLVDFEPLPPARHADAYFGLLADLETLFERSVDLVETATLRNPYRRREIEATQVLLHAAA